MTILLIFLWLYLSSRATPISGDQMPNWSKEGWILMIGRQPTDSDRQKFICMWKKEEKQWFSQCHVDQARTLGNEEKGYEAIKENKTNGDIVGSWQEWLEKLLIQLDFLSLLMLVSSAHLCARICPLYTRNTLNGKMTFFS